MTEAAKEARRAYQRAWRKRNPEKVKEYNARYWSNQAGENGAFDRQKAAETAEKQGGGNE